MGEDACHPQSFELLIAFEESWQTIERHPEPSQAAIHFEMKIDRLLIAARTRSISIKSGGRGN